MYQKDSLKYGDENHRNSYGSDAQMMKYVQWMMHFLNDLERCFYIYSE